VESLTSATANRTADFLVVQIDSYVGRILKCLNQLAALIPTLRVAGVATNHSLSATDESPA